MINKILKTISIHSPYSLKQIKDLFNKTESLDNVLRTIWLALKFNVSLVEADILLNSMIRMKDLPTVTIYPTIKEVNDAYNKRIKPKE